MKHWLTNHWELIIIIFFLILVSYKSIKPSYSIAGWDNFSSSLNLNDNIYKTIFSSWRSYRGFGAESDSEITDLSHQVILKVLSLVIPINLVDQIFILACFWIGVIGLYVLTKYLSNQKPLSSHASLIGTLFYLFNLNTVGSFFYPMIMYTARYASFPWIIYSFLKFRKQSSIKNFTLLAVVNLIASSSYLTATVFVTLLLILGLIALAAPSQLKKGIIGILIIIGINCYWLIQFAHYSITKSSLLTQASTFINVNENQLNESPSHFSWSKLITLYPSFLYIDSAKDITTNKTVPLHPFSSLLNPDISSNWPLYITPILGIISGITLLFSRKTSHRWIPMLAIIGLFMVRKEYPPLGWMYDWLGNHIPYFKVVFRFGDAKYYMLIALAYCLGISQILHFCKSQKQTRITLLILYCLLFITFVHYRFMITADSLISSNMYVNIPPIYKKIATYINNDSENGRVLHLPYDTESYWKSYSWGYFGSSFIHFLLNKPLMERTFAPASIENDRFDTELSSLIQNHAAITTNEQKSAQAMRAYALLSQANIRYIIWDGSISTTIPAKNIKYWGNFRQTDTKSLIDQLVKDGYLKTITQESFDTQTLNNEAITLYQLSTAPLINNQQLYPPTSTVSLYQVWLSQTEGQLLVSLKPESNSQQSPTSEDASFLLPSVEPEKQDGLFFASDWHVLPYRDINQLRILINNISLPLPYNLTNQPTYVTTINTDEPELHISLLAPKSTAPLKLNNTTYTNNPNCLEDKTENYHNTLTVSDHQIIIATTDGSTCVYNNINNLSNRNPYNELTISFNGTVNNQSYTNLPKTSSLLQQELYKQISSFDTANYFSICLSEKDKSKCLNNHHTFAWSQQSKTITIPFIHSSTTAAVVITIPTLGNQSVTATLSDLSLVSYQEIAPTKKINAPTLPISTNISTAVPDSLSVDSYYFNPSLDALRLFTKSCPKPNTARSSAKYNNTTLLYNHNCNNGAYYLASYSPNKTYLWKIQYNLLSGKYPHMRMNGIYSYLDQFASYKQGYPSIPEFKQLQVADTPWISPNTYIQSKLNSIVFKTSELLIPPQPDTQDIDNRTLMIEQDDPNTGLAAISSFSVTEVPNGWITSEIKPVLDTNQNETEVELNPSMWKINVLAHSSDTISATLSQGFDQGWELYSSSPIQAFLGIGKVAANHQISSDTYTNEWTFKGENTTTYFAFYAPTRLAVLGLLVTIGSIMGGVCFSLRMRR
jgi:hypothetical protein